MVDKLNFKNINIGIDNSKKTTNLKFLIDKFNNIMLKMDIETFEFRWINSLSKEDLNKFRQIVIEFHAPFDDYSFPNLDQPTSSDYKMNVLKKIADTHYLIHFHPNTACGTKIYNN